MAFARALSFKFQLGTGSFGEGGGAKHENGFERARERADHAGNEPRVYADLGPDRVDDESVIADRRDAEHAAKQRSDPDGR
jgi:hypothetical protein